MVCCFALLAFLWVEFLCTSEALGVSGVARSTACTTATPKMDDGQLEALMEAEYREDRAPRGSMVRALESALAASTWTGKD